MLLNLTYPSSGEIFLFGKNPKKHSKEIYSNIGSIIETPGFYENLTAYENLKIISNLRGDFNPVNIDSVLEMVSLDKDKSKKFKDFSLGMKQRLGIAAAIMHSPELLILDEPINGLDPFGIKEIRALLKRLSHEFGITILISSHILSEIENIADVIGFMDEGVLIDEISREELFNRLDKHVEFEVSDIDLAVDIFRELELKENEDFTFTKDGRNGTISLYTHLSMRDKFNALFVKAGIDVKKVNLCEENLEEFFTRFVSNN
jgi:ABC-2 type transport system ATP-binding protein/bacitracin transport system ATP-binding protein